MPRTAEMRMAEPYDATIFVLVSGAILIRPGLVFPINIVRDGIGIRTELDQPERHTGSREGMPHAIGPDNRIDIRCYVIRGHGTTHRHKGYREISHQVFYFFHVFYIYIIMYIINV